MGHYDAQIAKEIDKEIVKELAKQKKPTTWRQRQAQKETLQRLKAC